MRVHSIHPFHREESPRLYPRRFLGHAKKCFNDFHSLDSMLQPPRPPLPPRCPPPLWPPSVLVPLTCPPPKPSPAPIVSAAVANLLERSICVRMVFARYETTNTSWIWSLLHEISKTNNTSKIRPYKSLSISAGSTLGASAKAFNRN